MRAIIEFTLPEEQDEFDTYRRAMDYAIVLEDLDQYLRAQVKYTERPDSELAVIREVRDKLRELMESRDLS